jgi:branched-chain amino acid transport system substrate-binding protein
MKRRHLLGRRGVGGRRRRAVPLVAAVFAVAMAAPALGAGSAGAAQGTHKGLSGTVTIGASVSLSGDFSATGTTTKEGYEVFQKWVNEHGGILGHKVQFKFLSDGSSPTQVTTNYQKLITVTHVDFVVGPYSTLLTKPASVVAHRYGMALVEGIGGGPSVFESGLNNVFDVSASAAYQGISLADWLVKNYSPQPVAYAAITTPFSEPIAAGIQKILDKHGFSTATFKVYPLETSDFSPIASAIEATHAKIFIAGTQPPDGYALLEDFASAGYNPTVAFEASGPDQGQSFVKAVGKQNTTGVMWPNTWYPGAKEGKVNQQMEKIAEQMFHVKLAGLSANIAEAFSAAEVLAQAVNHNKSLSNKKLISYLHSKAHFSSVQGPVCFTSTGQNKCAQPYVFQWQDGNQVAVLPATKPGVAKILNPKPKWGQSKY